MSNLLCRTPVGQKARTCVITRPTLILHSLRYCSTGTTFEKVPSISSSVAKSQATEKPSSAPPHSVLPTKTLLRSLLVTTISSHQALLVPCLSILSFLTKPRGVLLDVDRNPLIHWFLKKTFYDHFCAGEKESQVRDKIRQIKSTGLRGVILTYARETVQDSSTNQTQFAHSQVSQKATDTESCEFIAAWREGYLKTVDMLGEGDFLAPKLTGAGPKVTEAFASGQPVPTQMVEALDEVCQRVVEKNARLLMDAEQHSFLQGIHSLTLDMMRKYNRNGKAVVYNTYQAYLKSTPSTIASHMEIADQEGFTFGLKLVRGAYMRSDPRQLIHDTKQDTDIAYNSIVRGVLQQRYQGFGESGRRFPTTDLFLATHNIESAVAAHELHQARLQAGLSTGRVEFGQLLGMADGVSFGLLQLKDQNNVAPGVYKCLTWGRKMGIAILNGLLNTTTTTESTTNTPLPTHFIATVRSTSSLTTLQSQFQSHLTTSSLTIHSSTHNHAAITSASTIILACDPTDIPSLLSDPSTRSALCSPPPTSSPKLLISIAAGWTVSSLRELLSPPQESILYILRALPNICATISQSITAIELPSEEVQLSARTRVPQALISLTEGIFSRIGRTVQVRADQMDTFTVLGGSTPAFIAVFVEALVIGSERCEVTGDSVLKSPCPVGICNPLHVEEPHRLWQKQCSETLRKISVRGNTQFMVEWGVKSPSIETKTSAVNAARHGGITLRSKQVCYHKWLQKPVMVG
ncbi:hypothetical protein CBS11852_6036 [Aspergillus niger]|nr:hypothetical protein CBS11852_6036 [Aspergillus niger]